MSNTGSNRRRDSKKDENLSWLERIVKEAMEREGENQRRTDIYRWESEEEVEEIAKEKATGKGKKPYCIYCGCQIPEDAKFCPICGNVIIKCVLCKQYFFSWEKVVECPHCGALGHRDHLLEWIKVKGCCPSCEKRLSQSDIV